MCCRWNNKRQAERKRGGREKQKPLTLSDLVSFEHRLRCATRR